MPGISQHKPKSFLSCVLLLTSLAAPVSASGSGATGVPGSTIANQYLLQQNREGLENSAAEKRKLLSPLLPNTGYIEAKEWYQGSVVPRICATESGDQVIAKDGECYLKIREDMKWYEVTPDFTIKSIGPGLTPQEYLDSYFGEGITQFVGVSPSFSGIYIYYREISKF